MPWQLRHYLPEDSRQTRQALRGLRAAVGLRAPPMDFKTLAYSNAHGIHPVSFSSLSEMSTDLPTLHPAVAKVAAAHTCRKLALALTTSIDDFARVGFFCDGGLRATSANVRCPSPVLLMLDASEAFFMDEAWHPGCLSPSLRSSPSSTFEMTIELPAPRSAAVVCCEHLAARSIRSPPSPIVTMAA